MFDLAKIFAEMSPIQLVIVSCLGLMAVFAIAVFVERLWVYGRTRRRSARFGGVAGGYLAEQRYDEFQQVAEKNSKGNPLAALLAVGIKRYRDALVHPSP